MIKIGDVFEITLSDGRRAYGQYIFRDKLGSMIRVFDVITEQSVSIDQLKKAGQLFPPLFTGLFAAIRKGYWKKIGYFKVDKFVYPNFVGTNYDEKTGKASIWFLWNGERYIRLGNNLPDEYKNIEYLIVWDPHDVVRRIETGEYPYPYRELILHNKYLPNVVEDSPANGRTS